ncbi:MAG TPA: type II toxin-antitoxin system RelE/ParE family toxin [Candidatus Binataceae bacterium]|nr:type II toxin-antitoxin system RelE/ParE family toxin [Candidatus Binataceae bacterium]
MRVRWLDQAVNDLKAVRSYIAEDNPLAAGEVAQRIRQAVRVVRDYPAAGRSGRVPNTRELVVTGTPYILPYRVRAGAVEILRVLHGARKWPDT